MGDEKVTVTVPSGMEVVTPIDNRLTPDQFKKFGWNVLVFTAPFMAVFFYQLSIGVDYKASALLALVTFYGVAADYFKKLKDTTPYLRDK